MKSPTNTRIIAGAILVCVFLGPAHGQEKGKVPPLGAMLRASLDRAVLVKMPEGMKTVVIGNPSVAHVSFDKSGLAVVTGRSFGETNLIVLDEIGDIISQTDVVVTDERKSLVSVQSGVSNKVTVSCDPRCYPVAAVGDDERSFSSVSSQFNSLATAAQQAAQASAGSAPVSLTQPLPPAPAVTVPPASPGPVATQSIGRTPRSARNDGRMIIPVPPAPKFEGVSDR